MEQITKIIAFTSEISILEISYLIASILFILGLKKLSHPATARAGNLWAAAGMGAHGHCPQSAVGRAAPSFGACVGGRI